MRQQAMDSFTQCLPLFQALGDSFRQEIIFLLSERGAMTVNEITDQLSLSRPAVSHHLKILREQSILTMEQKGTKRYYALDLAHPLGQLKQLIVTVEDHCL